MIKSRKILLIGGTGNLGSSIIKSKVFKNLDSPSKQNLNLLKSSSISRFLKNKYHLIINCAGIARMKECEKNPLKAIEVNIFGTLNLIKEIINYETNFKKQVRLIHISSDGVYPSIKGNYSENSPLKSYNFYGWTKLHSESIVKLIKNHVVIRTRFFDKTNIIYDTAATDIFTSAIEVQDLAREIKNIALTKFVGVINVGERKRSDFENYKKFKPHIKPCKRKDIVKDLNFEIAKDASMNLRLFRKLKREL